MLYNDDPQNFQAYRFVFDAIRSRHPDYTFAAMLAEREAWASTGADFILTQIVKPLLPPEEAKAIFKPLRSFLIETYDRHNLLNAGAFDVLRELRATWRLGIIANQPPECRQSLERHGLLDFFDVVAISDEVELHKPDVRLYEWALAQAGCEPSRSVMIGDRRNNDIAPAKNAGMRRFKSCGRAAAAGVGTRTTCWRSPSRLLRRDPLFSAVPVGPEPDAVVATLAELPRAIRSLDETA